MSEKSLADKIDKLINVISNQQVAPVAPVAPVASVLPVAPVHGDYDNTLLIKVIDTKVDRLILDVSNIDKNYSTRIDNLEREKTDKKDFEDHKKANDEVITKLVSTKDSQTILISIGIGLITILTTVLIYYIFKVKV